MNSLLIKDFKNAYGIKSLNINLPADRNKRLKNCVIYAPNGVFKTSFAKTFINMHTGNNSDIKDRLNDLPFSCKIEIGDQSFTEKDIIENIIIYSKQFYDNDIFNNPTQLLNLVADKQAIRRLQNHLDYTIEIKKKILDILINIGIKKAKLDEVLSILNINSDELTDVDKLSNLIKAINNSSKLFDDDDDFIDWGNIQSKAYAAIDSVEFHNEAQAYNELVKNRVNRKIFDNNFNELNFQTFESAVERTNFLSENRSIFINDEKYQNIDKLKELFKKELESIISDPKILNHTNELTKALGTSKIANSLKKQLENPKNISILSHQRKGLLLSKLKLNFQENELKEIDDHLSKIKLDISLISKSACEQKTMFEKALDTYITRFHPAFNITIENKADAVLGKIPRFKFTHFRSQDKNQTLEENEIRTYLSSGQETALMIIHFIFEYLTKREKHPILLLDDVIETFDYANRSAMIEYINELINDDCNVIILTHNFEFYCNLNSRIGKLQNYCAYCSKIGVVTIQENSKLNLSLGDMNNIENLNSLISSIPFAREILELSGKNQSKEYSKLTSYIHYKNDTPNFTLNDLYLLLHELCNIKKDFISSEDKETKYIDFLEKRNSKLSTQNFFDLKEKLIISLKCRILLEKKIIESHPEKFDIIKECDSVQTRYLQNEYKNQLSDEANLLLDRVLLNTSEFIHLNSFMYEPLVDIDPITLKCLEKDIENLDIKKIWKFDIEKVSDTN